MNIFAGSHIIQATTETQEHSSLAAVVALFPSYWILKEHDYLYPIYALLFAFFFGGCFSYPSLPRISFPCIRGLKSQLRCFCLPESFCYLLPLLLTHKLRKNSILYLTSVFSIAPVFFREKPFILKSFQTWNKVAKIVQRILFTLHPTSPHHNLNSQSIMMLALILALIQYH